MTGTLPVNANTCLKQLSEALSVDPNDRVLRLALADCYEEYGDLQRAIAWRLLLNSQPMKLAHYWWDGVSRYNPLGLYNDQPHRLPDKWVGNIRSDHRLAGYTPGNITTCHLSIFTAMLAAVEGYVAWQGADNGE